jgi:hypothetical protein
MNDILDTKSEKSNKTENLVNKKYRQKSLFAISSPVTVSRSDNISRMIDMSINVNREKQDNENQSHFSVPKDPELKVVKQDVPKSPSNLIQKVSTFGMENNEISQLFSNSIFKNQKSEVLATPIKDHDASKIMEEFTPTPTNEKVSASPVANELTTQKQDIVKVQKFSLNESAL